MYESLEATLHDLFWRAEEEADESPLLESFLQKYPGNALEVGCGSGRLLLPLIEKGHAIEGIEISADMIEILQKDAEKRGLTPTVHHQDICQFQPSQPYSAITIPAFTLQLLSRELAKKALTSLREMSTADGGLYITLFIPWAEIMGELEDSIWHLDKQAPYDAEKTALCYTKHKINRLEQTLHRHHRYEVTNARGKRIAQHRSEQQLQWYFLPEITSLLAQAGWHFQGYDADFTEGLTDSDAHILTVYASAS